jgi:hypothetical protein
MMPGERYGRLTVLAYAESRGRRNREMVTARCDCGTVVDVRPWDVRTGHTISCGCAKKDALTALHERARQRVLERCQRYLAKKKPPPLPRAAEIAASSGDLKADGVCVAR